MSQVCITRKKEGGFSMSCSSGKNEIETFNSLEDLEHFLETKVTKGIEQFKLIQSLDRLADSIDTLSLTLLADTEYKREFCRRRLEK